MSFRNNGTTRAPAPYILPDTITVLPLDRLTSHKTSFSAQINDFSLICLADSIRQYGVLQPILVRPTDEIGPYGKIYEIISGQRRFRAATLLGMKALPCIIVSACPYDSAELSAVEEIHRERPNMFEIAEAISYLANKRELSADKLAERLSVSRTFIQNKLELLRLSQAERQLILKFGLTERHARAILRISDTTKRIRIIEYINRYSLNALTAEHYIDRFISESGRQSPNSPRKIILKDIKVFYNSIDRAISLLGSAGIEASAVQTDYPDFTEVTIRVPKQSDVSRETSESNTPA